MKAEAHGELCQPDLSTGCAAVPGQLSEPCTVGPRVCSVAVAPGGLDRKPQGATRSLGRYLCQCQIWTFSSSTACSGNYHCRVPESLPGKQPQSTLGTCCGLGPVEETMFRMSGRRLNHCLLNSVPPGTTGPTGSWCGKLQGPMCSRVTAVRD